MYKLKNKILDKKEILYPARIVYYSVNNHFRRYLKFLIFLSIDSVQH
jgi:hypothetical protein